MSNEKQLLSIGELSKLSGSSVRSLRHYDKIGILKPKYINEENGYRYYSTSQVHILTFIQICTEIGLSLKDFPKYVDADYHINFKGLIKDGEAVLLKELKHITSSLEILERMKEEIKRIEAPEPLEDQHIREVPERHFYCLPYEADADLAIYYNLRSQIVEGMIADGYEFGYEWGLLYEYSETGVKKHAIVEIPSAETIQPSDKIITLPAGKYLSTFVKGDKIDESPTIFAELFAENPHRFVVQSEAYIYDPNDDELPPNELRILL